MNLVKRSLKRFIETSYLTKLFVLTITLWLVLKYNQNNNSLKSILNFIKVNDDLNLQNSLGNYSSIVYPYNENTPVIFIGGVPRSGTTLMRAVLDAHPLIRCGEETHVIPNLLDTSAVWMSNKKERNRLKNAGVSMEVYDSAMRSFILEIIVKHGKPADNLCNKDPLVLGHSKYVEKLFPNAKFILMIRDARASVHSVVSRKVGISGWNITSYPDCFKSWNRMIRNMYTQCTLLGNKVCLPVYYEQLILHPEKEIRKILKFLEIEWNDAVLNHEDFIGSEITLSKTEHSTDQVVKPINLEALTSWFDKIPDEVLDDIDNLAPMLKQLGYNTKSKKPNYGEADLKIKENTKLIQENKEHWLNVARNFSSFI